MKSLGYCMIAMGMVLMFAMGCKPINSIQTPPVAQSPQVAVNAVMCDSMSFMYMDDYNDVHRTSRYVAIANDSCEYIRHNNSSDVYIHKGSCKKCRERDSIMIDKLLFEYIIKTNYEKSEQKMDSTMIIRKTIDSLNAILTGVPK